MTNDLDKDQAGSIRSRLLEDADELTLQAGIFSRRNWGALNKYGNVEVLPGLLDTLTLQLEQIALNVREAAEALALPSPRMIEQKKEKNDDVTRTGELAADPPPQHAPTITKG